MTPAIQEIRGSRVLITGGSGFVGTNLVAHFLGLGAEVLSLDHEPPRHPAHAPLWRKVDLLDREGMLQTTREFRPDYFLHFGARTDLRETTDIRGYSANVEGVCHVIEAIRAAGSVRRAIFTSSQLVCRLGYRPQHDRDFAPSTLYGYSKALGECILRAAGSFETPWCIVRPTSLWGPWFDVPYRGFFTAIERGMYVHTAGTVTPKQWGFVGNTVYQVAMLLTAPREAIDQRMFYLADYEAIDLSAFADRVQSALGTAPIRSVPRPLLETAARAGDVFSRLGWKSVPLTSFRLGNIITPELQDLRPLEEVVGPLPYSVGEGIDQTVAWLRQEGSRPRSAPQSEVTAVRAR